MRIAITVKLSGNDTGYHYVADEALARNIPVGCRVVVPNKLKDDGTLSMSIGTFAGIASGVSVETLKPIVQFLDPLAVQSVAEALAAGV